MRFVPFTPLIFQSELVPHGTRLVGLATLVCALDVKAPVRAPYCVSEQHIHDRVRFEGGWKVHDKRFWPGNTFGDHLTFALKHENAEDFIMFTRQNNGTLPQRRRQKEFGAMRALKSQPWNRSSRSLSKDLTKSIESEFFIIVYSVFFKQINLDRIFPFLLNQASDKR